MSHWILKFFVSLTSLLNIRPVSFLVELFFEEMDRLRWRIVSCPFFSEIVSNFFSTGFSQKCFPIKEVEKNSFDKTRGSPFLKYIFAYSKNLS